MNKVKEYGLKVVTLILCIIGTSLLVLAQVITVAGAIVYRWARDVMRKYSYDMLDLAWDRVVDDAADSMDNLKTFFLTAKTEL